MKLAKKETLKTIGTRFIDLIFWIVGGSLYALSVNMFSVPNKISLGGLTGISTLLNFAFNTPIGVLVIIMNIPLFIIAWRVIGVNFITRTVIATTIASVLVDVTKSFAPVYTGDKLLAAIYCGLLCGIGLALIFIRDATTGGTDIIAKLIHIKYPHISIGRIVLMVDALVIISAGIVYKNIESMLYAAIAIYIASRTIDYVIYGTGHGKMLMIVTKHGEEIAKEITSVMGRGVTILPVKGGYTGENKNMLICAIRSHEISKLTKIIKKNDENAFMVVTEAGEILGEGFSKPINSKKI